MKVGGWGAPCSRWAEAGRCAAHCITLLPGAGGAQQIAEEWGRPRPGMGDKCRGPSSGPDHAGPAGGVQARGGSGRAGDGGPPLGLWATRGCGGPLQTQEASASSTLNLAAAFPSLLSCGRERCAGMCGERVQAPGPPPALVPITSCV